MTNENLGTGLTPHWQEIRSKEPDVHECLKALTAAIFEHGESRVPLSTIAAPGIDTAETQGFVERHEAEEEDDLVCFVCFADDDVFKDYIVRHSVDVVYGSWNEDAGVFARAFRDVVSTITRVTEYGSGAKSTVLRLLAEGEGSKLIHAVRTLAEHDLNENQELGWSAFWTLYSQFCDVLPHLDVSAEEIIENVTPIIEAASGDLAGGKIYGAVEQISKQSEERAIAFYQASKSHSETAAASLSASALVGLATLNFTDAHERALDLTEEERPVLRRAGMNALSRLNYEEPHSSYLQESWERLQVLRENPDEETDYVLVRSFGNLIRAAENLSKSGASGALELKDIGSAIAEIAIREDAKAHHAAAEVLFRNAEEYVTASWYREILLKLADTPSDRGGTIQRIDTCVRRYLQQDDPTPRHALEFIRAFVLNRSGGIKTPDLLGTTLHLLKRDFPRELQSELTRWFASSEPRLHRAASELYQRWDQMNRGPAKGYPELSKTVLDQTSEQNVVGVVLRICGYVTGGGDLLASLVFSAIRREPVSVEVARFIGDILTDHVLYNYPEGSREALKHLLETAEIDAHAEEAIRNAMKHSEQYYEKLRQLPRLKEFTPPSSRIYKLRRAQQKQKRELMDRARDQSDVMKLFAQLPLKYGRAFFSEHDPGEYSQPSNLSSISHSAELPRGGYIDPVGTAYQRAIWRQVGLEQKELPQSQDEAKN